LSTITRTALLPYPAEQMFAMVNDIASYPQFVPGCTAVDVMEKSVTTVVARVHVSARGFNETFTTRNTLAAHSRIDLELADGPFEHFAGAWLFQPLGNAGCKVTLQLDFQLRGLLRVVEPLVGIAADAVVDAFVKRARELPP